MKAEKRIRYAGIAAIMGGIFGVALAPLMVVVKYLTGWSVIPEPAWIAVVRPIIDSLVSFTTPVGLWIFYGSIYTVSLLLMFLGLLVFARQLKNDQGRMKTKGLWLLLFGFCLVISGDAVHTATWHQNGLTTPTPGTNVIANTAYAVHMMGMSFILISSLLIGISGLRKKFIASWLAWFFISILPSAIILSVTLLPTTPSGALWIFSFMMIVLGYSLASNKSFHLVAT